MSTPELPKQLLGKSLPSDLSRSAPAFLQRLDGLLHSLAPRYIATWWRPWGSFRFRFAAPPLPTSTTIFRATQFIPPEEFPSLAAVPHLCGPYLLVVTSRFTSN